MRARLRVLCFGLLLPGAATAQEGIHPDELALKPKIDAAIDNGVEALLRAQLRDGTWGRYGQFEGGKTALCTYALLKCGVGIDHPAVRRAMLFLEGVRPRQTYTIACMMLAYSAAGSKAHLARVKRMARQLVEWQLEGDYGYPFQGMGADGETMSRPDLSNTQYAALGLWVAQKHKIKIPTLVWLDLIAATLAYRSKAEPIKTKASAENKSKTVAGGVVEVQGFGYRPRKDPSGSMTTAGVSILQICKLGLGARMPRKIRSQVDGAIEKGLAWLSHHFSVRQNPGRRGAWHYYYLYGLERVGSLTRVERMGRHRWYVKGARLLTNQQNRDGMWKGRDRNREVQTAFALLFLRRATQYGAAVTGGKSSHTRRHLFAAGGRHDDVTIKGAGQQPLALYIPGFGADLKDEHKTNGIRVVQVEYLLGDRVLGQLQGKSPKAWTSDTFLYRAHALERGVHRIRTRVTLVAHDVPAGGTSPTVQIESARMRVDIRDVFAEWMNVVAKISTPENLLLAVEVTAIGSTNLERAGAAIDRNDNTHWVCHDSDEKPELTLVLSKSVNAGRIVLTQAGSRGGQRGEWAEILNVEVYINKDVKPLMIEMDDDQMAATVFALPRRRKINRLRFRIVASSPGRRGTAAGFSEIMLLK
jgi:hypothetical protein